MPRNKEALCDRSNGSLKMALQQMFWQFCSGRNFVERRRFLEMLRELEQRADKANEMRPSAD